MDIEMPGMNGFDTTKRVIINILETDKKSNWTTPPTMQNNNVFCLRYSWKLSAGIA